MNKGWVWKHVSRLIPYLPLRNRLYEQLLRGPRCGYCGAYWQPEDVGDGWDRCSQCGGC